MQDLRSKVEDLSTTQVMNGIYMDLHIGCLNRKAFEERDSNCIALVDVDSLKWVNDNLGHVAGDRLLRYVVCDLQNKFGEGNVYRLGGDEFAVRADTIAELELNLWNDADTMYSYGVGEIIIEADDRLNVAKDQRLLAGARAARGEKPAWADAEWLRG